jgi:hypothetical protein
MVTFVVGFRPEVSVRQGGSLVSKSGDAWQVSKSRSGQAIRIAIPAALVGKYFTRGYMPYPADSTFAYTASAFAFSAAQTDVTSFTWYSFPISARMATAGQTYSFSLLPGAMDAITVGATETKTNNVRVDFKIKVTA